MNALQHLFAGLIALPAIAAQPEAGFERIFDGQSLAGWETPDSSYWSVEDGAITARITKDHPCTTNQYLVWKGGELADFELKLKSRVNGSGGINNGFQFRSRLLPDHDICGYQVDNNLQTPWLVRLYDEYGRHTLAMRGERAVFDADGKRHAMKLPDTGDAAWFRLEDWHEYHLICKGPNISLFVDGRLAAEVQDNDPRRAEPQGVLALQLHSGPPTIAQFKDIRLRVLAPPARRTPAAAADATVSALRREALAWWPLDTGGHGAEPPLRHVPGWEKFELNVLAAGPKSRPDAKMVVLDGAHFEAGNRISGAPTALTIYLRVRDPQGQWNSPFFVKRSSPEQMQFALFSTHRPEARRADISFEVRTDRGTKRVSFPVSAADVGAWHDLVGRYDGESLALYCDGQQMAAAAWTGNLAGRSEPLVIGADVEGGKPARHFHGELETAALWSRALSAEEIAALSGVR